MDYALFVIAFLWAFWAMYVPVMGIYAALERLGLALSNEDSLT